MAAQATFNYKARDAGGELVTGTISAGSSAEVGTRLRSEGKYVIDVSEQSLSAKAVLDPTQILLNESAKRVRRDDVIAFAQQLSVMLEAGVPLGEALETFRDQTQSREFRQVLDVLVDDVLSGESFSAAMSKWPRVFPTLMISLMKASEVSGTLDVMLGRVGSYLAKERRTLKQIRGALTYPLFMLILGMSITAFLLAVVLPRFAKIYEQRSATLPLPTRFLMAISDTVMSTWMYAIPAFIVFIIGLLMWKRTPAGRRALDWLRLHTPVLRHLFGQLYLARATRTMATLLGSGVGILDVISISRGLTNNIYWDDLWDSVEQSVRDGQGLSEGFVQSPVVPPNVASMIVAGDRSGQLPAVMSKIAIFSDEELDATVKQTTAMIEPLMICIMGVVVGGVAIALLLPIFTIGQAMSGG